MSLNRSSTKVVPAEVVASSVRYPKLNALGQMMSCLQLRDAHDSCLKDGCRDHPGASTHEGASRESQLEFVRIVSHEFKTPLTSLCLSLQLLSKKLQASGSRAVEPQKLIELTQLADRQVERLEKLMDQFVETSMFRANAVVLIPKQMALAEVAAVEIDRLRFDPSHAHRIVQFITEEVGQGCWDRKRVAQAVRALLSNAAIYGGELPRTVRIGADSHDAWMSVEDQGPGIDEADQTKVFELFWRGVPSSHYGGAGIGLYLARQIALAHRGSLWVQSVVGKGSIFTLKLPHGLEDPIERTCPPRAA